MRYFWLCGLLAGIVAGGSSQPLRTPDGMLWAGTTFQLHAIASNKEGQTLSLSPQASVTVGVISNWRVTYETENAQTISTSEDWFTMLISNRGNTVDALNLRLKSNESSDASPWNFALFEERENGAGFNNGLLLSDTTSLLAPGESRRLYLRARPPGNRQTDGAFLQWIGIPLRAPSQVYPREFAVGTTSTLWAHTTAGTWTNNHLLGEPVLLQGRLHWLGWDGHLLRLFRTPSPLSVNTTFSNNIAFEARININGPTHNTVVIDNNWYILTQNRRIMFFPIAQAQGGTTLSAIPLSLPQGVEPEPSLPLIRWGSLLCFADRQNRLWLYDPATFVFAQLPNPSSQAITALSPLSDTMLAVGRADGRVDVYQGGNIVFSNLRLPGAGSQAVRFVCLQDGLLTVVVGTRIGMYHFAARKWQWVYTLDSPPITRPVRDAQQGVCYVLTQNGWLYAISHRTGAPLPLYPHRLFSEPSVIRATLHCQTRADRDVPYLYLQAQLNDGTMHILFVTGGNPLNRFVHPSTPTSAPIGTRWLFTGNTDQDLALCWISFGAGNDGTRGIIYAFRLR